jgi:hypothetical protein
LYQDALWVAESEPNLSWLLLVSSVETAANQVYTSAGSADEVLREADPVLVGMLETSGGAELVANVAKQIGHMMRATKKFLEFVNHFMPNEPTTRPDEQWNRVDWTQAGLKTLVRKVYSYRSRSLHDGIPFPVPMLEPPYYRTPESCASEVPLKGLSSHSKGGTWLPDDLPMNLHCFHYIARGALIKWWMHMAEPSRAASPTA